MVTAQCNPPTVTLLYCTVYYPIEQLTAGSAADSVRFVADLTSAAGLHLQHQHRGKQRSISTMGDVANKDEAFKCLDIARAALKAGEHARAERFAAKALRLYRCSQVRHMRAW